jgi:hypothetical protein
MPKANAVLANGTKVTVTGTAAEVAAVLQSISGGAVQQPPGGTSERVRSRRRKSIAKGLGTAANARMRSKGPADYIRALADAGYFKTKRGLGDVQAKLEESAHIYPVTHLSPVLFRLVRGKELRRIKEGGTWKYVNP